MILPDINLLVYAYASGLPQHTRAKKWLTELFNSNERVMIPWIVIAGFARLISNHSIFKPALVATEAAVITTKWLANDKVTIIEPGPRHLEIFISNLQEIGGGSNLVMDCHLASIAEEFGLTIHSNDTDFKLFQRIKWINPLA